MNVQARIVLCVIAGVLAGLLTWFVSDVSGLVRVPDAVRPLTEAEGRQQQMLCMVFGGLVGALLGAVDGLLSGSGARTGRAAGVGLLVGVVSGAIGLLLGQWFFGALYQARPAGPLGPAGVPGQRSRAGAGLGLHRRADRHGRGLAEAVVPGRAQRLPRRVHRRRAGRDDVRDRALPAAGTGAARGGGAAGRLHDHRRGDRPVRRARTGMV
jgi:hypothetical protein